MTNAEKFQSVFGIYATELWAKPEKDFLIWLNSEVADKPERKKGYWIPVDSFSAFGGDQIMWEIRDNPTAFYYCSECKNHAYAGEDGKDLLTDFCPSCGADMRDTKTLEFADNDTAFGGLQSAT